MARSHPECSRARRGSGVLASVPQGARVVQPHGRRPCRPHPAHHAPHDGPRRGSAGPRRTVGGVRREHPHRNVENRRLRRRVRSRVRDTRVGRIPPRLLPDRVCSRAGCDPAPRAHRSLHIRCGLRHRSGLRHRRRSTEYPVDPDRHGRRHRAGPCRSRVRDRWRRFDLDAKPPVPGGVRGPGRCRHLAGDRCRTELAPPLGAVPGLQ